MAEIGYHQPLEPLTCEVCRYLEEPEQAGLDARYHHTLARFAQAILIEDLPADGSPIRFSGIYESEIGGMTGPTHRIGYQHWTLALLETPQVKLTLTGDTDD